MIQPIINEKSLKMYSKLILYISVLGLLSANFSFSQSKTELPNILWIVAEDLSPYLGCYGDANAITPNLDKLATEGTRYLNAFANTAVCAPARSTLITGMYASTTGTHNMRSTYNIPSYIRSYSQYLMDKGYYCTNNAKEDYNSSMLKRNIWDESSDKAHYKNKKKGQPFFAIFNVGISHEHVIHNYDPKDLVHDPSKMNLPPYHPDSPDIRKDWAKSYDNITLMDKQVGEILKDLKKSGQEDNTIVFFYGDHGGILPRSKRFLYDTGTRVPLLIKFPPKYMKLAPTKPNGTDDRLVSFIDFGPTVMSLAGIPTPEHMDGKPFLGKYNSEAPDHVNFFRGRMDERIDYMLGVCDKGYRLIYNFYPDRPTGQHISYLWRAAAARAWEQAYRNGQCSEAQSYFWEKKPTVELYDMKNDPWEINNLADKPEYKIVKEKLFGKLIDNAINTKNASFIPESELIEINRTGTIYEYAQSENYPIEQIVDVAIKSATGDEDNYALFQKGITHKNATVRYWSLIGLTRIAAQEWDTQQAIKELLNDDCPDVAILAAKTLYQIGQTGIASETISKYLNEEHLGIKLIAINAIQQIGDGAFAHFKSQLDNVYKLNSLKDEGSNTIYIKDIISEGEKRIGTNKNQ